MPKSEIRIYILTILFFVVGILAVIHTFKENALNSYPKRAQSIEISNCIPSEDSVLVLLGDDLTVINSGNAKQRVGVFDEYIDIEQYSESLLSLRKLRGPVFGKITCDGKEIIDMYVHVIEKPGSL